jgi:hypothetical protein
VVAAGEYLRREFASFDLDAAELLTPLTLLAGGGWRLAGNSRVNIVFEKSHYFRSAFSQ